jgi:hypothetical protein
MASLGRAHPHTLGISPVFRQKNINAGNPLLHCMGLFSIFLAVAVPEFGQTASFRRDPQPQSVGQDGDGADAAKPEACEPQQTLRQRPRILFDLRQ